MYHTLYQYPRVHGYPPGYPGTRGTGVPYQGGNDHEVLHSGPSTATYCASATCSKQAACRLANSNY
eukprot:1525090-Rhodomonas_salina.1